MSQPVVLKECVESVELTILVWRLEPKHVSGGVQLHIYDWLTEELHHRLSRDAVRQFSARIFLAKVGKSRRLVLGAR